MTEYVKIIFEEKTYKLPVIVGSEGEKAIDMFTVMFAIGRLPGWIAQWKESMDAPDSRLIRPRQIYNGHAEMKYTPIDER